MARSERNPFEPPAEPRTGLDLIRWTLFEYRRLEQYSGTFAWPRFLALYLRATPWIALGAVGLWFAESLLAVARFPDAYEPGWVVDVFQSLGGRLLATLRLTWFNLAMGLAIGLAGGLAVGLGFLLGYFRLPFWLVETAASLMRLDLRHNPYLWDGAVMLPIWGARRRLTGEARGTRRPAPPMSIAPGRRCASMRTRICFWGGRTCAGSWRGR